MVEEEYHNGLMESEKLKHTSILSKTAA